MENDEITGRRRNVVLVAQRRGQGLHHAKEPVTAGRNMCAVLNVARRPEALGGSVVALVEKGIKRVEDGLDAAVFAARFGLCGHSISPLRDNCGLVEHIGGRASAANRQHMIEANSDILLPEPQHWLQIVRRKSDVDYGFLPVASADRYSNDVPTNFSKTSQSLAAAAASRACDMISASAGAPRSSPIPPGP
jgi:hypothetical protein